jgi:acyl-CoA synthetase (AMP-forming)/AMP-acid ligase II
MAPFKMLIHDFLTNSAKADENKIAVVHGQDCLSYGALNMLSNGFAADLCKQGVQKCDRVILFLNNSIEYLIAYFAILKAGAVVVPLDTKLVPREFLNVYKDSMPTAIVTDDKNYPSLKRIIDQDHTNVKLLPINKNSLAATDHIFACPACDENDLAMIIYTSGTTGDPKGVMLSHLNLSSNADSIIEYLGLTENDKIMVVLPFFYSYGNSLLTTHIKAGATLVINNQFLFPNMVLDDMVAQEVTGFAGVPSSFAILINKSSIRKYHFPKLRYITQAGGAMPPQMIEDFIKIMPDIQFYVMYGQTEASARLTYLAPRYLNEKMGSVGKAIPGVDVVVVNKAGNPVVPGIKDGTGETGEIWAKGSNIMQGYWNLPRETASALKDGWLCTGDLARVDADGFIYIIDRKKNIIKSGANRISPVEIENIVLQIPGIKECAAVGVADELLGEAICLFVVADDLSLEKKNIFLYCKKNLAPYKLPKTIEFVSELPKTSSGKIKRQALKGAKLPDHRC